LSTSAAKEDVEDRVETPLPSQDNVNGSSAPPETPKKDPLLSKRHETTDDSEESDSTTPPPPESFTAASLMLLPTKRACSNRAHPALLLQGDGSRRVMFPVEVKIGAIQRIVAGDTQAQVARDLQCPLSTVASWWQRRGNFMPQELPEPTAREEESKDDLSKVFKSV
jgi:hypothetical protein